MKRSFVVLFAGVCMLGLAASAGAANPLNAILSVDSPEGNMGGSRVRVVHASPDAPAVDVWVDGSLVFENVAFEEITDFVEVPAGTYNVQVVPNGATSPVVIEADLALMGATDYTVVATDFLANITPVILTADGSAPTAGNAWIRVFHGSPDAPAVDIAVADGGPVLFANLAFQDFSEYAPVPAGSYDLEVRPTGSMDVVLSLPGIAVADGGVYTAYATGLVADIGALENFYFVPAAARAPGALGSFFLTQLEVNNSGSEMATFQLLWLPRDTDNAAPAASEEFDLVAGMSMRFDDVLGEAFGVGDDTDALGALALISDSTSLKIFSRTANQADEGSFGQAIPGFAADELIQATAKSNHRERILFFTENDEYRSNIGFLNGVGSPITVNWERFGPDGMMIDDGSAELPAWGNIQINGVFGDQAPVAGAYIDVWTDTPGGAFMAYGSVLDNLTSDPTTVLPQ